jgi:mannose-6-phosphate isomerase-like protein (cupin superfamily)
MGSITSDRYVFDTKRTIRYRFPTHTNDLVMDRSEAQTSEAFVVLLEPGEAPPLHAHHDAEQVFYVMRGRGELQIGMGPDQRFPIEPGNLVRIPPGTHHHVLCQGEEPLCYLSIDCFLEGRPKDEPTWESHVRAMCARYGWNFESVRHT